MKRETEGECKHLRFVLRTGDVIGMAYCPDCRSHVDLVAAFNNLVNEIREVAGLPLPPREDT